MTSEVTHGAPPEPSWGIAALVDEPLPLLQAFVGHHLHEGAAEIRLFPDRDDPALEAAMAAEPRVRVLRHDARNLWRMRRRPESLNGRQRQVAARAFAESGADWMLFCDADEFVTDGAALTRDLARVPDGVDAMRLPVRERVFAGPVPGTHIFEGDFRTPLAGKVDPSKIYGDMARYLNRGVIGHAIGKTLYRRGADVDIGIHNGRYPEARGGGPLDSAVADEAALLHFDGLTALNWAIKLRRKTILAGTGKAPKGRRHPGRLAQIEHVQGGTMESCLDLFEALATLPDALAERLERRGVLSRRSFDPRAQVAALWPDLDVEAAFDPEAYDALLRARYADTFTGQGGRHGGSAAGPA